MADYKNYIVRYDIQADVTKAVGEMQALSENVNKSLAPLKAFSKYLKSASDNALRLKQNAKIDFTINLAGFQAELEQMVGMVNRAASEMQQAIYRGLTASGAGKKSAQRGAVSAFTGQSIKDVKAALKDYEREYDKLMGTPTGKNGQRKRDGLIQMAKNANNRELVEERQRRAAFLKDLKSDGEKYIKQQEAFEKRVLAGPAASKSKISKAQGAATASPLFPSVKQIQAYEKAFGGKSKTITFTIKENPKNTATITAIKKKLAEIPKVELPVGLKIMTDAVALNEQIQLIQPKIKPLRIPVQIENAKAIKNQISNLSGSKGTTQAVGTGKGNVGMAIQKQPTPSMSPQGLWRPAPLFTQEDQTERNRLLGKGRGLSNDERTRLKELNKKYIDSRVGRVLNEQDYAKAQGYYRTVDKYSGQSNLSRQAQMAVNKANTGIENLRQSVSQTTTPPLLAAKLPPHPTQIIQQQQAQLAGLQNKTATIRLMLDPTLAYEKLAEVIAQIRATTASIQLVATGTLPAGATSGVKGGGSIQGSKNSKGTTGHMSLRNPYVQWSENDQYNRGLQLEQMRKDATSAFSKLTPYEKQLAKQEEARKQASRAAISAKQKSNLNRLQTLRNNAVAPYVTNASQMKLASANLPYFNRALQTMGLTPSTELWGNSAFLKEVQRQMIAGNVKVPSYLPSAIAQAEKAEAKAANQATRSSRYAGNIYAGSTGRDTFYDRSRRWAYPFTGNTSFGARTPMAVDMAKGMGVMFAIGGAMSAIGGSFSQAMEYQNTMETTKAILQNGTDNYTSSGFENMARTVRNVGIKTKFSAPEVASAARFLAMAGYDIESINNAIRPIADLALMGDYDLGETADKMTNIMTTFGVNAQRMKEDPNIMRKYGNIMAAVATRSNTDVMMLAESAKYGGGVANMYGREDPNNFADTMAIFGVMGNAGIQGSSAGTALRMMYQNIFNPNKKQQGLLKLLKEQYGIDVKNEDGSKRAMSDIILDMANKIPEKAQADIVSKLFRITAQPGAMASILAASQADGSNAEETYKALQSVDDVINKGGLSALAKLMIAARDAVYGDSLGSIAESKQNTIQGLWAQVTSTFTEGIVKAFEERKGGLTEMLTQLRDYFAKPETISMIKNLLDMIIELGKVMAYFVKLWAQLYNFAPGVIKTWVIAQMVFTQIGSLIAPVVSLIGILNRFGVTLGRVSVAGAAATASFGRTSAASVASMASRGIAGPMAAPLVVGRGSMGWGMVNYNKTVTGAAAMRARQAMINAPKTNMFSATDALLAGSMLMPTPVLGQRTSAFTPLSNEGDRRQAVQRHNQKIVNHYAEVRARANRIYGWGRVRRGFTTAATVGLNVATFAPFFGGLKAMFFNLMTGLMKALGLLVNPVTLAITAIGGLGYGILKLKERIDGTTDGQQESLDRANQAADTTLQKSKEQGQWYQDFISENKKSPTKILSNHNIQKIYEYNQERGRINELYSSIFNDLSTNASKQSIETTIKKWNLSNTNNPLNRLALGSSLHLLSDTPLKGDKELRRRMESGYGAGAGLSNLIYEAFYQQEENAEDLQMRMVQQALMREGGNSSVAQNAIKQITELRQKYLNKQITESEYLKQTKTIKDSIVVPGKKYVHASNMTPDQFKQLDEYGRSQLWEYQKGLLNVIEATIRGDIGTKVGEINAYNALADKSLKEGTDKWYQAIARVIHNYPIIYDIVDPKTNNILKSVQLQLSMLPDGRIDYGDIINQVKQQAENLNLTLQDFANMLDAVYDLLPGKHSLEGKQKFKNKALAHQTIDKATAEQYWIENIAGKDNRWTRAGWTMDRYAKAVSYYQGDKNAVIKVGNEAVNMAKERANIRYRSSLSNTPIKNTDNISNTDTNSLDNTPRVTSPNQSDYASNYEKDVAKPTQVNINIQNLANFDRTMVAANSDERDLIASMEGKIAEAVYRIFAEASNQVQLAYNTI